MEKIQYIFGIGIRRIKQGICCVEPVLGRLCRQLTKELHDECIVGADQRIKSIPLAALVYMLRCLGLMNTKNFIYYYFSAQYVSE